MYGLSSGGNIEQAEIILQRTIPNTASSNINIQQHLYFAASITHSSLIINDFKEFILEI